MLKKADLESMFKLVFLTIATIAVLILLSGDSQPVSASPGFKPEISEAFPLGESYYAQVFRKDKHQRLDEFCVVVKEVNGKKTAISCKTATSDEAGIKASVDIDKGSLYEDPDYDLYEVEVERLGLNMYWSILVPKTPDGFPSVG